MRKDQVYLRLSFYTMYRTEIMIATKTDPYFGNRLFSDFVGLYSCSPTSKISCPARSYLSREQRFLCAFKDAVRMSRPVCCIRLGGGGHVIVPSYPTDDGQSKDDPHTHHVL